MPQLALADVELNYQSAGAGDDLILVHGLGANLAFWFPGIFPLLSRRYRVTAYDLRGHGVSDVTPSGYTSADMADDLRQLHAALGLGPAYLVGHSFGGVVAAHAAAFHPGIVAGVVIADTYFPGLAHVEPNVADTAIWQELRKDLSAGDVDIGEQVDFGRLFDVVKGLTDEQTEKIRGVLGPASVRWLAPLGKLSGTTAGSEMFQVAGLTERRIRSIRVPLVGLYDEQTTFGATGRYLEAYLPQAKMDVVPGARHLAPLQSPEEFTRLVKQHLREMAAATETA